MMGGFGGMGFGGILWIVLIGVVIWAVVKSGTTRTSTASTDSARAVLDTRLARGELSIEEYRKLREVLG
jgi:putative membrane protein